MKSGFLVQILGGLAIGLALGLLIAWVLAPVEYTDTSPSSLRMEFKEQYRASIASAFSATGNLQRARARLFLLGDQDPRQALAAQAERMIAAGTSPQSAFDITFLINALDAVSQLSATATDASVGLSPTPEGETRPTSTQTPFGMVLTPQATNTPGPSPTQRLTNTPKPTGTPTPTQGAPFVITARDEKCDTDSQQGLLLVEVRNKKRQPIEGQEIIISWSGGEESFFTGLKPEINNGYADYLMQPGVAYSVRLASGGETASGITPPVCTKDGVEYVGTIQIIFQQP